MATSPHKKIVRQKKIKISAVDLFCGAGGLTHGMRKESISVKAGYDIDQFCKYAFEYNNCTPFIETDVAKLTGKQVKSLFGPNEIKVVAGCAPCQPFSKYTQGRDTTTDKKWSMLYEFARIIQEVRPDVVTMENVPQLLKHKVYKDFETKLKRLGYQVRSTIVFCPDYGIPQTRQRLVLLASRLGPIDLIKPTHKQSTYKTVRKTIGKLPKLKAGETNKADRLHSSSTLSDLNLRRIKASTPDGSWLDWKTSLVADCHQKSGRQTYRSVYGRMAWDKPSPTITTQFIGFGNGRFGHPKQHRALSLREGALLQTFPKSYRFVDPKDQTYFKHVARMIGNAVPVKLGAVIGKSIRIHVEKHK
ncbi:MAG: DNA (cytosine-5-)-methyltransferase [Alphaproteobacteria bacterium]